MAMDKEHDKAMGTPGCATGSLNRSFPESGLHVERPTDMLSELLKKGLGVHDAGALVRTYYECVRLQLESSLADEVSETNSGGSLSTVSSSRSARRRARRRESKASAEVLARRQGYCYLRFVRPEFRASVSEALGSDPSVQELYMGLTAEMVDWKAAAESHLDLVSELPGGSLRHVVMGLGGQGPTFSEVVDSCAAVFPSMSKLRRPGSGFHGADSKKLVVPMVDRVGSLLSRTDLGLDGGGRPSHVSNDEGASVLVLLHSDAAGQDSVVGGLDTMIYARGELTLGVVEGSKIEFAPIEVEDGVVREAEAVEIIAGGTHPWQIGPCVIDSSATWARVVTAVGPCVVQPDGAALRVGARMASLPAWVTGVAVAFGFFGMAAPRHDSLVSCTAHCEDVDLSFPAVGDFGTFFCEPFEMLYVEHEGRRLDVRFNDLLTVRSLPSGVTFQAVGCLRYEVLGVESSDTVKFRVRRNPRGMRSPILSFESSLCSV